MAFGTSTLLRNRHRCPVPRRFRHPKGNPAFREQSLPAPPRIAPANRQSAFCLMGYLRWSFHADGIVQYGPFVTGFFDSAHVLEVRPRGGVPELRSFTWPSSVTLFGHTTLCLFICRWTFGLLLPLATVTRAAVDLFVRVFA